MKTKSFFLFNSKYANETRRENKNETYTKFKWNDILWKLKFRAKKYKTKMNFYYDLKWMWDSKQEFIQNCESTENKYWKKLKGNIRKRILSIISGWVCVLAQSSGSHRINDSARFNVSIQSQSLFFPSFSLNIYNDCFFFVRTLSSDVLAFVLLFLLLLSSQMSRNVYFLCSAVWIVQIWTFFFKFKLTASEKKQNEKKRDKKNVREFISKRI